MDMRSIHQRRIAMYMVRRKLSEGRHAGQTKRRVQLILQYFEQADDAGWSGSRQTVAI